MNCAERNQRKMGREKVVVPPRIPSPNSMGSNISDREGHPCKPEARFRVAVQDSTASRAVVSAHSAVIFVSSILYGQNAASGAITVIRLAAVREFEIQHNLC